jgi:hypothetical protein
MEHGTELLFCINTKWGGGVDTAPVVIFEVCAVTLAIADYRICPILFNC